MRKERKERKKSATTNIEHAYEVENYENENYRVNKRHGNKMLTPHTTMDPPPISITIFRFEKKKPTKCSTAQNPAKTAKVKIQTKLQTDQQQQEKREKKTDNK